MRNVGKMVDMQAEAEKPEPAPSPLGERRWYGGCISLGKEQLERLDLEADCDVGDTLHGFFMARVTAKSDHEGMGPRVELEITHLAVEDEDAENQMSDDERAERRYKSKDG